MAFKKFPKTKFWDLFIDKMIFHPHRPPGPFTWSENHPQNDIIYVDGKAVPSDIKHQCWVWFDTYIKIKTPPRSQITKADVSKWGSGGSHNRCGVRVNITNSGPEVFQGTKIYSVSMPTFTWADVQTWPAEGKTFRKKLNPSLKWEPNEAYVAPYLGKKRFRVEVWIDHQNQIKEIDEFNNNNPGPPYIVFRTMKEGPFLDLKNTPPSKRMIGSTMAIKWRAKGIKKKMKILLYKDHNKLIGVIADNIVPPPPGPNFAEMSHSWKVGNLLGSKVAKPGKKYWIMVRTKGTKPFQTYQRYYLTLYRKMKFKKPPVPARDEPPSRRRRQ